jgi:hypothetical protein
VKKKLQVFVSSTFTDMRDERQATVEAILRAGHIPAGMELFAAGDESQLETIRRWIDDSDVFMLILGGRYGSIEPKSGKSYIRLEYEYATKNKKPLFAAVIDEVFLDAKVQQAGKDVLEKLHGQKLEEFRQTVLSKTSRFFKDVNELKVIVFESLGQFEQNEDLVGWVRGSDVVNPKAILEEMERLQAENAELRNQLPSRQTPASLASMLSEEAKSLLVGAKEDDGRLMCIRTSFGTSIQTGKKGFIESNDGREEACWKAALDELLDYYLMESVGGEGTLFRTTKLGYAVADLIEGSSNPEA